MEETLNQIKKYIYLLFQDIQIHDNAVERDKYPYIGVVSKDKRFSLSWGGENNYIKLVNYLFSINNIQENWSVKGIESYLADMLVSLADIKCNETNILDEKTVLKLAADLFDILNTHFEKKEYFIPIHGLVVNKLMKIGEITLWPVNLLINELNDKKDFGFLEKINPNRDTVASSSVVAERNKAGIILQEKTEKVLNILRYFSAIVYWDRPTLHIYLDGRNPTRNSAVLNLEDGVYCSLNYLPLYTSIPIELNDNFIEIASFYGFEYIMKILATEQKSPIQNILLNSIYWYGDATQDINPLSAFIKYYLSIESLLKEQNEKTGSILSERVAWILEEDIPEKRERIKKTVKKIIYERNNVFHEGLTKTEAPKMISQKMHNITMKVMYRFTDLAQKENWQTKQDFIKWIDSKKNAYSSNLLSNPTS